MTPFLVRYSQVIRERGVSVHIKDQPEILQHVPSNVAVMLFRNDGNYDFDARKWMLSSRTGMIV